MPIYFDLSTTYQALGSKPWGMLRVENCIGWELQKYNVCFVTFHKGARGFVRAQSNFAMARNWTEIEQLIFAQPILPHRCNPDIIYNLFRARRIIRRVKDFKTDQIFRRITWIFAHYYMYFDFKLREDFFALLSAATPQSDLFVLLIRL